MIEEAIVVNKLQEEGIDVKLASGVQFETEEALSAWVGTAKTFVTKPKDISEYNEEELRKLADEGKVKSLQSAFDKIRAEAAASAKGKKPVDDQNPLVDMVTTLKTELENLKNGLKQDTEKQKFDLTVDKYAKGLEDYEVNLVKATLSTSAKEDDVKKAFEEYRSVMIKKGLTSYKSGDSAEKQKIGGLGDGDKSYISDFVKREIEKKEKSNLKK